MRFKIILPAVLVLLAVVAAGWIGPGSDSDQGAARTSVKSQAGSPPSETATVSSSSSHGPFPEGGQSAPLLRFHPEDGEFCAYRLSFSANAQVDIGMLLSDKGTPSVGARSMESVQASGGGQLHLKFYPHSPESWNVGGLFSGIDYRINGEIPYWLDALGYPFTFRMNSKGVIDQFEFTKGIPEVAREFTRDILSTMQAVLSEEGKSSWETREIDTTGRYRATYDMKSNDGTQWVELRKRKTGYLSTRMAQNPINSRLASSRPRLEHAEALIHLPGEGAWLQKTRYTEISSAMADGKAWTTGERTFAAERVDLQGGGEFPETFDEFRKRLNSESYLDTEAYRTDPVLDRLGAGMTMANAIELYRMLAQSEKEEERRLAEKFLVNYLRQHPMASFDLVYLLDTRAQGQIDHSTELVLWRLLTEAGHREAQQALAQAASGQGYSELTQWRAVAYAHDFARPEAELVDELWRLHNTPGHSDPELQDMALYALGSLGGKENISEEMGERLHQQLTAELVGSATVQEQALALAAIGNTGSPEMIDAVTPYMSSPDAEVRAAAYDAMRRMQDPAAADLLIQQYQSENSAPAREVAAKTLARLPANDDSAYWARQEVLQTQDSEAQMAMVRILGESLEKFPENESALRQLLEQNPARKVKKEVYRYIAPR